MLIREPVYSAICRAKKMAMQKRMDDAADRAYPLKSDKELYVIILSWKMMQGDVMVNLAGRAP